MLFLITWTLSPIRITPADPELIIDSQNPSESLILKKIRGSQSCGGAEPVVGALSRGDEACIVAWVTALAQAGAE
jgi:hypothetical protein